MLYRGSQDYEGASGCEENRRVGLVPSDYGAAAGLCRNPQTMGDLPDRASARTLRMLLGLWVTAGLRENHLAVQRGAGA